MTNRPTNRMKYSDFLKLSPEDRFTQSEFFRNNKPNMIPVVIFTRNTALPELPNCK
jgi:hypothetical protein